MGFELFDRYREIIPDWPDFLATLKSFQPRVLWTNTLRLSPQELQEILRQDGFDPQPLTWYSRAFRLPPDSRPGRTLAFLTGCFHVQEEVSLLPVFLLDPRPGERVLDLCAAPGNKTLQAAMHMENRGSIFANDKSVHRVGVMRRNIDRLGVSCISIATADGANLPANCGPFDRVLVDVPCSCEGTTRRTPGVLDRPAAAGMRSSAQKALLRKAIQRCRPGGRIVYSTCTYAPEENEVVVDAILRELEPGQVDVLDARIEGFASLPGLPEWRGHSFDPRLERTMRVYPHLNNTGGFYVAVLQKGMP